MWHNGIEYRCRWVQYSQSQRHDLGMGIDEPENDRRGKAPGGSARLLQDTAYPNLNYQLARSLHRRRHAHLPPPSASRAVRQHHYRQCTLCGLPRAPCTGMVTKHTKTRPSSVLPVSLSYPYSGSYPVHCSPPFPTYHASSTLPCIIYPLLRNLSRPFSLADLPTDGGPSASPVTPCRVVQARPRPHAWLACLPECCL